MVTTKKINYELDLNINKASLSKVQAELKKTEKELEMFMGGNKPSGISDKDWKTTLGEWKQAKTVAQQLNKILDNTFNKKMNQIDLKKLNEQVNATFGSFENLKNSLVDYSATGAHAYNLFGREILNTNLQLTKSSKILDTMADTMSKTIRWGVASRIMNNMVGSIEKAWSYSIKLDQSLNDIRIVTGKSADEMERFAVTANKAAKNLGASTRDYTEASLIYYQQGLSDEEAQKRADITLKTANVTGQSAQKVSEQLTAVWNGYNVTVQESELYVDKLAAVAAATAADLEELSTGMSKVASTASTMGVDIDQLSAQLATIVSVTRQAPESVGTALRTIYARMGDIEAGLDEETSLGNYTEKMAQLGVNVLNADNELRDMGEVIEEVGNKWSSMSREQQVALAQTMAGTRQYNNLLALFENWDMYNKSLQISIDSAGTLQEQQDIYMESVTAHLQQMRTEAEKTYDILFDTDTVNGFIDTFTGLNSVLNTFLKGLGGGANDFVYFGALLSNIFNKQIANGINNTIQRINDFRENAEKLKIMRDVVSLGYSEEGKSSDKTAIVQQDYSRAEQLLKIQKSISNEEFNELNTLRQKAFIYQKIAEDIKKQNGDVQQTISNTEKELQKTIEVKKQFEKLHIEEVESKDTNERRVEILKKSLDVLQDIVDIENVKNRITTAQKSENEEELKRLEKELELILKGKIKSTTKELDELRDSADKTGEEFQSMGEEAAEAFEKGAKAGEKTLDTSSLVSGVSALIQLGTSLSGIIKTLNDPDLSNFEKFSQISSNLILTLPTLLYNLKNITILFGVISSHPIILTLTLIGVAAVTVANAFGNMKTKAEQLQDSIGKMKEATEKAKEEFDKLNNTISNYKTALDSIKNLEEGTIEFYNAITNTNQAAQELIDKLNLLSGIDYTVDSNGLITINEDTLAERQFKAQQEWYRNSAQLSQARTNLEKYNQQEIVKSFTKAINKNTFGFGISEKQGELILENANSENLNLKELISDTNKFGLMQVNATRDASIEITGAMTKFLPQYKGKQTEITNLERQTSANLARGYGSQADVEKYNQLSSNQQNIINDYLTRQRKISSSENNVVKSLLSTNETPLWRIFSFLNPTFGLTSQFATQKMAESAAQIQYGKNALGYQYRTDGSIVDAYGNTISDKELKKIDSSLALSASLSGEYSTKESLSRIIQTIQQTQLEAFEKGFNETSQNYIAEGVTALLTGSRDYNFNLLTDEEKTAVKERFEKYPNMLSSDISSSEMEEWLKTTGGNERSTERTQLDLQAYNAELKQQAENLETSSKALELYGKMMERAGEITGEATKETAKAISQDYKFNKAYNEAVNTFEDVSEAYETYIDALKNGKKVSYDIIDQVAELQEKLEGMLGFEVSSDFLINNFEDIKTMLSGTAEEAEEAYNRIWAASIADLLQDQFNLIKDEAVDLANALANTNPGEPIEASLAESLINMVNDAHMTKEEIETLFSNMQITVPPIEQSDVEVKDNEFESEPTTTRHHYHGQYPTGKVDKATGKMETKELDYWWDEEVGSVKQHVFTINGAAANLRKTGGSGGFNRPNFSRSPSSSSKSGGGGGSSKEPNIIDPLEKEKDRYHDINITLKQLQNELSVLDKQKSKLFGGDLIENLNKQLGVLNKQIDATNEKMKIAQDEARELRGKLRGNGVQFDSKGIMTNYAEAYQAQLNYVNSIINQYNSMGAEAQEGFKDTVENAKENFEKFVKNISRYDEVITDLIPGLAEDIQEAIDKQIDIQIQEFDMEIELRLDLSEAERDWNEFKKKIIDGIEDDDILGNAMARLVDFSSYYKEDETGAAQALRKQIDNTLKELYQMDETGQSRVYGDNRTKALEDLKKYYDELRKQMTNIQKLQEEIHQSYIDMMDEAQEKFDDQIKSYEIINNLIEHDMKVISLVYGDEAYRQLSNFYDKQQANYNAQLDFQRQQVEFWKEQMDAAEAGTDAWDEAKEKWVAATEDLNSLIETSIENLQDKYLNAINAIFQDLNNKVTNNLGLDYVEEEWNLINKNADQYLDTINQLYGIQALENKYLDAINSTDNVAAQKQLKKIMDEELANLRERDKLTEYDIERANKKYEIALKQIALEEAQQNKNQLRLRRDSQGNYRYEFISDIDQVNQLQNDLDDLYNSLYNFDKQNYADNLNELYSVWKEFQDKMAEAAQINDPQARAERELLIQEQYGELINGLVDQNETIRSNLYDSAFEDLARLYDKDKNNFLEMTQAEQDALMNDLIPYWDAGVQHMADVFAGEDGFINVCKDAFDELHDATEEYENDLKEVENTADISFDNIASAMDDVITETQELLKDNNELINSYRDEMDAISGVVDELDNLVEKYNESAEAAKAAEKAAYDYWSEQQRQAADKAAKDQAEKEKKAAEAAAKASQSKPAAVQSTPSSNNSGGDGVPRVGDVVDYVSGIYHADSYGGGASGAVGRGGKVKITIVREDGRPYPIHIATLSGGPLGWLSRGQISGYDTGGYTGEWGNNGRLALLHQKELVLNKEDTKNLLNAVNVMRTITDSIGARVLERLAIATSNNGFGGDGFNGVLDQNVHIEAQFPNVRDSREIEDALNNLVNAAAQRAQTKER